MVLQHIPGGTGLIVEGPAAGDADVLSHGDLYVIHVAVVPEGLDHRVGEAQGQQILDRLLPQVVIDAIYLLFGEQRREFVIDIAKRLKVRSQRLFHHDARRRAHQAGPVERATDRRKDLGRRRQIHHQSTLRVRKIARLQSRQGLCGRRIGREIMQVLDEPAPGFGLCGPARVVVVEPLLYQGEKFLPGEGLARQCDNIDLFTKAFALPKRKQRGVQLAQSQIALAADDQQITVQAEPPRTRSSGVSHAGGHTGDGNHDGLLDRFIALLPLAFEQFSLQVVQWIHVDIAQLD